MANRSPVPHETHRSRRRSVPIQEKVLLRHKYEHARIFKHERQAIRGILRIQRDANTSALENGKQRDCKIERAVQTNSHWYFRADPQPL